VKEQEAILETIKFGLTNQKKKLRISNVRGFSLIEVMLALGVLSVLGYGLMVSTSNSIKGQNRVKVNSDVDNYVTLVASQIADPAHCIQVLGNSTIGTTAQSTTGPQALAGLPPNPVSVSQITAAIQNSLMSAQNNGATKWPAQLILTFTKNPINGGSTTPITRNIPFMATTAPYAQGPAAVPIVGCGATDAILTPEQICQLGFGTWNSGTSTCTPSADQQGPCLAAGGQWINGACSTGAAQAAPQTITNTNNYTYNYTINHIASATTLDPLQSGVSSKYICVCITYGPWAPAWSSFDYFEPAVDPHSIYNYLPADCTNANNSLAICGSDHTHSACYYWSSGSGTLVWSCTQIPQALAGP